MTSNAGEDYQIIVLIPSGEPPATAACHPTLMCFRPSVPLQDARDVAQQYAQRHDLDVLPNLMPNGLLTGEHGDAIAAAFADDPELSCVVHQLELPSVN